MLLLAAPAFAQDIKIVSVNYQQQFRTGEPVQFVIVLRNNDAAPQFAEVDVTITNLDTERETTLTPVLTGTVPARSTLTLTGTYPTAPGTLTTEASGFIGDGLYTVSFPLFDGIPVRRDTLSGRFPLRVGIETESVRVFPEVLNLGTLPPGRYMHPIPVEVSWSFFRFNQLRHAHPFTIRLYTDNAARFSGVPGAVRRVSPAGLVHMSGRYSIPLKIWNFNYGPDIQETGWDAPLAGPPPVDEDDYWIGPLLLEGGRNLGSASWVRVPDLTDMTVNPVTWRRLIGQDADDSRFVSDLNLTGDFTLKSPFTFYMATEAGATAVEGTYSTTLVVELWSP
ncbi:MAG: hypothetical protein HYZ94_01970 [Candidatus Omnitrophica bacterium]|nr:hypothetical protein [Candidatus Omnitrophota bacterium]